MTRYFHRLRFAALVALAIALAAGAALAQDRSPGLFGDIFNRGDDQGQQAAPPQGGGGGNDIAMRLDRIENTMRQLTGNIEQLQYRNQQTHTNEVRRRELAEQARAEAEQARAEAEERRAEAERRRSEAEVERDDALKARAQAEQDLSDADSQLADAAQALATFQLRSRGRVAAAEESAPQQ